jgi:hypothetical protein
MLERATILCDATPEFAVVDRDDEGVAVDCVFHTKLDSDFAASWTAISHEAGQ